MVHQAAFMARTYLPSHVPRLVDLWKKDLARVNPRAADSLADPASYPNLFPDIQWAIKAEEFAKYVSSLFCIHYELCMASVVVTSRLVIPALSLSSLSLSLLSLLLSLLFF
jgi:hypothetical protein